MYVYYVTLVFTLLPKVDLYFISLFEKKIQVTKIFEDQDANRKFPPWAISEFV